MTPTTWPLLCAILSDEWWLPFHCSYPHSFLLSHSVQFPYCTDDKAISVACLDLHYYVSVDIGRQVKDEKKDTLSPLTLSDLRPEDELNAISSTENDINGTAVSSRQNFSGPLNCLPSFFSSTSLSTSTHHPPSPFCSPSVFNFITSPHLRLFFLHISSSPLHYFCYTLPCVGTDIDRRLQKIFKSVRLLLFCYIIQHMHLKNWATAFWLQHIYSNVLVLSLCISLTTASAWPRRRRFSVEFQHISTLRNWLQSWDHQVKFMRLWFFEWHTCSIHIANG